MDRYSEILQEHDIEQLQRIQHDLTVELQELDVEKARVSLTKYEEVKDFKEAMGKLSITNKMIIANLEQVRTKIKLLIHPNNCYNYNFKKVAEEMLEEHLFKQILSEAKDRTFK